jgi:hypothetical protein
VVNCKHLESVLGASRPREQLVFADFAVARLDAAAAGGEWIWGRKFGEFLGIVFENGEKQ